jgi:hypothetical protein
MLWEQGHELVIAIQNTQGQWQMSVLNRSLGNFFLLAEPGLKIRQLGGSRRCGNSRSQRAATS